MNNVCLIGRLTRDPELRTTSSGLSTCTVTIAVDSPRTDEAGNRAADFISVVFWRGTADTVCKYCKKGTEIGVTGRISSRSYDAQDGSKRYVTEVVANSMQMLRRPQNEGGSSYSEPRVDYQMNNDIETTSSVEKDPFEGMANEVTLSDDDLPF